MNVPGVCAVRVGISSRRGNSAILGVVTGVMLSFLALEYMPKNELFVVL